MIAAATPIENALNRNDWIGICMAFIFLAGIIVVTLWKALANEKKRADDTAALIQKDIQTRETSAQVMQNLVREIQVSTLAMQQMQQKTLDAFVLQAARYGRGYRHGRRGTGN